MQLTFYFVFSYFVVTSYTFPECSESVFGLKNSTCFWVCKPFVRTNTSEIDSVIRSGQFISQARTLCLEGEEFRVSQSTLKLLPALSRLTADGSKGSGKGKSTIESNAFDENTELRDLLLHQVDFPTIEHLRQLFQPLYNKLEDLSMTACSFSEDNFDPFPVLREFSMIETLIIKDCGVISIPAGSFAIMSSTVFRIEILDNKNLTRINANTFNGLSKLKYLDLDNNRIDTIEQGAFDNMTSIREIDLRGNRISQLPRNLFENSPILYILVLHENPIAKTRMSSANFNGPANMLVYDDTTRVRYNRLDEDDW